MRIKLVNSRTIKRVANVSAIANLSRAAITENFCNTARRNVVATRKNLIAAFVALESLMSLLSAVTELLQPFDPAPVLTQFGCAR